MNRSETQSSKFFERAWTIILGGGTLYIVSHRYPESREGCERVTLYSWGGGPFRTTICSYPKLSPLPLFHEIRFVPSQITL